MRNRDQIMKELKLIRDVDDKTNVARNQMVLAEILLDIRDELVLSRGLHYLAVAPKLSDKACQKLAQQIKDRISKEEKEIEKRRGSISLAGH